MKGWRDRKKGDYGPDDRVRRLFRGHVATPSHPRGRIVRLICAFCKPNKQITPSQFHHLNYAHPFVGVWTCTSCHRKIELGTLNITSSKICDYTALVQPVLRPATSAAMREYSKEANQNTPF